MLFLILCQSQVPSVTLCMAASMYLWSPSSNSLSHYLLHQRALTPSQQQKHPPFQSTVHTTMHRKRQKIKWMDRDVGAGCLRCALSLNRSFLVKCTAAPEFLGLPWGLGLQSFKQFGEQVKEQPDNPVHLSQISFLSPLPSLPGSVWIMQTLGSVAAPLTDWTGKQLHIWSAAFELSRPISS